MRIYNTFDFIIDNYPTTISRVFAVDRCIFPITTNKGTKEILSTTYKPLDLDHNIPFQSVNKNFLFHDLVEHVPTDDGSIGYELLATGIRAYLEGHYNYSVDKSISLLEDGGYFFYSIKHEPIYEPTRLYHDAIRRVSQNQQVGNSIDWNLCGYDVAHHLFKRYKQFLVRIKSAIDIFVTNAITGNDLYLKITILFNSRQLMIETSNSLKTLDNPEVFNRKVVYDLK